MDVGRLLRITHFVPFQSFRSQASTVTSGVPWGLRPGAPPFHHLPLSTWQRFSLIWQKIPAAMRMTPSSTSSRSSPPAFHPPPPSSKNQILVFVKFSLKRTVRFKSTLSNADSFSPTSDSSSASPCLGSRVILGSTLSLKSHIITWPSLQTTAHGSGIYHKKYHLKSTLQIHTQSPAV